MISEPTAPPLPKWPFLTGDILLLAVAWWMASRHPDPFAPTPLLLMVGCVMSGAWIAIMPFLAEHKARLKVAESGSLLEATRQITDLKRIGAQVASATSQWQEVQEKAGQAVSAANAIAQRMEAEARAFAAFMEKADQSEKAHLKLEVEKLRRAERDWVQVLTTMLDHVHALHAAAVRSGKRALIQQISQFQHACRDAGRRVGLVPFEVEVGSPFDPEQHSRPDPEGPLPKDAAVSETLATGFHFQGRLLRKPLVGLTVVQDTAQPAPEAPEDLFSQPQPQPQPHPEGAPGLEDAAPTETPAPTTH